MRIHSTLLVIAAGLCWNSRTGPHVAAAASAETIVVEEDHPLLNDPDLLGAMEIFMGVSPKEREQTTRRGKGDESWIGKKKHSFAYDLFEGFFLASLICTALGATLWCCYFYCCVPCGLVIHHRTDKQHSRWLRRIDDGRGVFAPLPDEDDSVWNDADSMDSMEYGHSHLSDEYGEMNVHDQDEKLFTASNTYFREDDNNSLKQNGRGTNNVGVEKNVSIGHQHLDVMHKDERETIGDILEVEMIERNSNCMQDM